MPLTVDSDGISTDVDHGVLTFTLLVTADTIGVEGRTHPVQMVSYAVEDIMRPEELRRINGGPEGWVWNSRSGQYPFEGSASSAQERSHWFRP
jgi:hypothetical protein